MGMEIRRDLRKEGEEYQGQYPGAKGWKSYRYKVWFDQRKRLLGTILQGTTLGKYILIPIASVKIAIYTVKLTF